MTMIGVTQVAKTATRGSAPNEVEGRGGPGMSIGTVSGGALQTLLAEVARLGAADQEAIFRALPVAQARALREQLTGAVAPSGFTAALQTQARSQATSEAQQAVARLDLEAMPVGVTATVLADLAAEERDRLIDGLSTERVTKLRTLLSDLPDRRLSCASVQLRTLLLAGPFVREVPDAGVRPRTEQIPRSASLWNVLGNWIRSWSHV